MATGRYNVCHSHSCRSRQWVDRLFDAIYDISQGKKARCSKCGKISRLELEFGFGLGAYPHKCRVLAAFLPKRLDNSWREGKYRRSFYPFLVIVKSIDEGYRSVWLPYWHLDKDRQGHVRVKYGQWASFVSERPFASLIRQAKAKGYKI